jgi:hypothetical protein
MRDALPAEDASPWAIEGTAAAAVPAGVPQRTTNTMAVVAMILSLGSLAVCGLTAPVGAIMGHVAQSQIRRRNDDGAGLALTAVIVGWIMTAVLAVGICGFSFLLIGAASSGPSTY